MSARSKKTKGLFESEKLQDGQGDHVFFPEKDLSKSASKSKEPPDRENLEQQNQALKKIIKELNKKHTK